MRPLQHIQAFNVVVELHLRQVPGIPGTHRFRRRGGIPQLVAAQIFRGTGIQVPGLDLANEPGFAFHRLPSPYLVGCQVRDGRDRVHRRSHLTLQR